MIESLAPVYPVLLCIQSTWYPVLKTVFLVSFSGSAVNTPYLLRFPVPGCYYYLHVARFFVILKLIVCMYALYVIVKGGFVQQRGMQNNIGTTKPKDKV